MEIILKKKHIQPSQCFTIASWPKLIFMNLSSASCKCWVNLSSSSLGTLAHAHRLGAVQPLRTVRMYRLSMSFGPLGNCLIWREREKKFKIYCLKKLHSTCCFFSVCNAINNKKTTKKVFQRTNKHGFRVWGYGIVSCWMCLLCHFRLTWVALCDCTKIYTLQILKMKKQLSG